MRIILLLYLLITQGQKLSAQADCYFKYCYVGNVKSDTLNSKKKTNIFIELPTPELMINMVSKNKGLVKIPIDKYWNFKEVSVTTGNSFFCGTPEKIIKDIFIGKNDFYTVYIIKGKKKHKKKISTKSIDFLNKEGTIYITFPQITI